jgi:hypothetical protein
VKISHVNLVKVRTQKLILRSFGVGRLYSIVKISHVNLFKVRTQKLVLRSFGVDRLYSIVKISHVNLVKVRTQKQLATKDVGYRQPKYHLKMVK